MPLTQQRNSFIDHLTSALNDVVYGQTCQEPNLTGAQASCLIELLRRASVEQAGKVIQGVSAATHLRSITAIMQVAARRIRGDHQAAESITAEAITELDAGQWQQLQHQFLTTHRSLSESIKALDTQRDECVGAAVDVLASLAYQAGMIMQKLRQV